MHKIAVTQTDVQVFPHFICIQKMFSQDVAHMAIRDLNSHDFLVELLLEVATLSDNGH